MLVFAASTGCGSDDDKVNPVPREASVDAPADAPPDANDAAPHDAAVDATDAADAATE